MIVSASQPLLSGLRRWRSRSVRRTRLGRAARLGDGLAVELEPKPDSSGQREADHENHQYLRASAALTRFFG